MGVGGGSPQHAVVEARGLNLKLFHLPALCRKMSHRATKDGGNMALLLLQNLYYIPYLYQVLMGYITIIIGPNHGTLIKFLVFKILRGFLTR